MLESAQRFSRWMREWVLPKFLYNGISAQHLFFETVPNTTTIMRSRVQTRQLYVFAHASKTGWITAENQVVDAITQGLSQFIQSDGTLCFSLKDSSANWADINTYEQAFALLAYCEMYQLSGERRYYCAAEQLHDRMQLILALPEGGYALNTANPDYLCQNPQMHLFEACLNWWQATGDPRWEEQSHQLYQLFCQSFFDPQHGCLIEFFAPNWQPILPLSQQIDPGHHYEWIWLLYQYQQLSGVDTRLQRQNLQKFADQYGSNPTTKAVMREVLWDGEAFHSSSRLWSQTERIKADVVNYRDNPSPSSADTIKRHVSAMFATFIDNEELGLYCDEIDANGQRIVQPVPASTLYHLYVACRELDGLTNELGK